MHAHLLFLAAALTACAGTAPAPSTAPAEDAPATAAAPAAPAPAPGSFSEVDLDTFAQQREAGAVPVVVDVRTDEEYAAGHVPGTVHIPLSQIETRMAELDAHKDGQIYVICQSGARSKRASKILEANGFHAVNVQGGTGGWIAAGHPVE